MAASAYPLPHVVFRLFDYADCPEDVSDGSGSLGVTVAEYGSGRNMVVEGYGRLPEDVNDDYGK